MDNALLLYLKKLEASMSAEFDDVLAAINNVQLRVDDIYFGNQISEWIEDLNSSGKNSLTYQDSVKMNTLISNTAACNDSRVAIYLLEWAIDNNKVGIFYGSSVGDAGEITWDSLATLDSVMSNNAAFTEIANNYTAITASLNLKDGRDSIISNYSVTENIIRASDTSLSSLKTIKKSGSISSGTVEKPMFLLSASSSNLAGISIYTKSGGKIYGTQIYNNLNRFITKIESVQNKSMSYEYVDFS